MANPESGSIPITPGSKKPFRKRVIFGFGLFIALSFALHFTMGPTLTQMAPMWRTPDVPDQGVSIITLSRTKLAIVKPTPTPSPPPRIYIRSLANLSPLKYLEMGVRGLMHAIKPPARRTSMLAVHEKNPQPPAARAPDSGGATDLKPSSTPKPNDSAQADTGADRNHIATTVQWGDDNPPRVLELASINAAAGASANGRHVRLEVDVGPDGNVIGVKVIDSSGDATIDAAVIDAVRRSHFAPATLNGLPVHGSCIVDFPLSATSAT